jgi:hypothetical protein
VNIELWLVRGCCNYGLSLRCDILVDKCAVSASNSYFSDQNFALNTFLVVNLQHLHLFHQDQLDIVESRLLEIESVLDVSRVTSSLTKLLLQTAHIIACQLALNLLHQLKILC